MNPQANVRHLGGVPWCPAGKLESSDAAVTEAVYELDDVSYLHPIGAPDVQRLADLYRDEDWQWFFIGYPTAEVIQDMIVARVRELGGQPGDYVSIGGITLLRMTDGKVALLLDNRLFNRAVKAGMIAMRWNNVDLDPSGGEA